MPACRLITYRAYIIIYHPYEWDPGLQPDLRIHHKHPPWNHHHPKKSSSFMMIIILILIITVLITSWDGPKSTWPPQPDQNTEASLNAIGHIHHILIIQHILIHNWSLSSYHWSSLILSPCLIIWYTFMTIPYSSHSHHHFWMLAHHHH